MKNALKFIIVLLALTLTQVAKATWTTTALTTNAGIVYYGVAASGQYVHVVYDSSGNVGYMRSTNYGTNFLAEAAIASGSPYLDTPIMADGNNVFLLYMRNSQAQTDWCCSRDLRDIYFRRSTDNGATWSSETRLTTTNTAYRIAISAQSTNVHVAWMSFQNPSAGTTSWNISYLRSTDTGTTWSTETNVVVGAVITSSNLFGAERPSILVSGQTVHLSWMDGKSTSPQVFEVYYKRSLDGGLSWSADTLLTTDINPSTGNPFAAGRPDLALTPARLVNAFEHPVVTNYPNQVCIQTSPDGGTNWTQFVMSSVWSGHASVSAEGNYVHMPWWDARVAPGGTTRAIWYRRSEDGGVTWKPEEQLTTAVASMNIPMVASAYDSTIPTHNGYVVYYLPNVLWLQKNAISPASSLVTTNMGKMVVTGKILITGAGGGAPAAAGGTYAASATLFTNSVYLVHTGDLTSIADSGTVTISLWFKLSKASEDGTLRRVAEFCGLGLNTAGELRVTIDTANKLNVTGITAAGTTVFLTKSTTSYTASTTWHHVACSFDLSDNTRQFLYIDGASELNTTTFTVGGTVDFANGGNFGVMARGTDGNGPTTGSLAEVWFHTSFISFSGGANLTLFRSASGHPVNLGANGSTPLGIVPFVYLANPFGTFQNNLGSGGNFTVTAGSLANDPVVP